MNRAALVEEICIQLELMESSKQEQSFAAFRRFRHVMHHGYALQLDWERMTQGVTDVGPEYAAFRARLTTLFGV